jgi:hypothetical protein
MADDPRIQQLLDQLLDTHARPEEVCESCPRTAARGPRPLAAGAPTSAPLPTPGGPNPDAGLPSRAAA